MTEQLGLLGDLGPMTKPCADCGAPIPYAGRGRLRVHVDCPSAASAAASTTRPVTARTARRTVAEETEADPLGEAILAALARAAESSGGHSALGRALASVEREGVERVGGTGPLDDSFIRQMKAFLHTQPIHEFEANKGRYEDGRKDYDLSALALYVLRIVAEGGDTGGVSEEDVVEDCAHLAERQRSGTYPGAARSAAQAVVDHLLNRDEGMAVRRLPYIAEDPATGEVATYLCVVRLLSLDEDDLLEASTEAINLLLRGFDTNAADDHAAGEYLAERQLAHGRLHALTQTTKDNRLRTRRFTAQVRKFMALARQDVTAVGDIAEVVAALDEARDHIDQRRVVETRMLDAIRHVLERPHPDPIVRQLARVSDYVSDCRRLLSELHADIMQVLPTLLDEQERQLFRPPVAALSAVALRSDVLPRTLLLDAVTAIRVVDSFASVLAGPRPPLVANLDLLVYELLTPPAERRLELLVEEPLDLTAIDGRFSRFTPAQIAAARRLLAWALTGCRLSDLLLAADQEGDPEVTVLVALGALSAFADRASADPAETWALLPDELRADVDGLRLRHPRFCGDDLLLGAVIEGRVPLADLDLALPAAERATMPPRPSRSRRGRVEETA